MDPQTTHFKRTFDLDKILEHVGAFGLWQASYLTVLSLIAACSGAAVASFAFTGFMPKHRCIISQCEIKGNASYYNSTGSFEDFVQISMNYLGDPISQSCKHITTTDNMTCMEFQDAVLQEDNNLIIDSCSKDDIIYDQSIVQTSITEDFQLICDNSLLQQVFNALFLVGMLIGSFTIGIFSDKFGRLKAMTLSLLILGASGALSTLVTNQVIFAVLRVLCGIGGSGAYISANVFSLELAAPKFRLVFPLIVGLGFVLGELALAMEAYLIRQWIPLQLWTFLPAILLVPLYFILPESTRWLISMEKLDKAKKDLKFIATINRAKPIPDKLFQEEIEQVELMRSSNVLDLFRHKTIRWRTFNMFVQWFSVTMAYYGLLFASTSLTGNPYLNFPLAVIAELPSCLGSFMTHFYGRKVTMCFGQLACGICCITGGLLSLAPNYSVFQIVFVFLGRSFAGIGFGTCYLYTGELMPTEIRNTAIGACSTVARMGGILALLMQDLRKIWPPLTIVSFGSVAMIAGITAAFFPETKNEMLPNSMEEAVSLGQNAVRRNRWGLIIPSKEIPADVKYDANSDTTSM